MTFRLTCPVCGKRDIYEFTFGGQERGPRPEQEGLSAEEHFRWAQFRMIPGGAGAAEDAPQREWWYHGQGLRGVVPDDEGSGDEPGGGG